MSKRPDWFDEHLNYPHGSLAEDRARQICWYAVGLEDAIQKARILLDGMGRESEREARKVKKIDKLLREAVRRAATPVPHKATEPAE